MQVVNAIFRDTLYLGLPDVIQIKKLDMSNGGIKTGISLLLALP